METVPPLTAEQLRWRCRRGVLELDLILEHCLKELYPDWSPAEQALFVELLDLPDPQLITWVAHKEPCENEKYQALLDKITSSHFIGG